MVGSFIIFIWIMVAVVGPGTMRFWNWTAESWQAVATGLTGSALALIAWLAWGVQRESLRVAVKTAQAEAETALAEAETALAEAETAREEVVTVHRFIQSGMYISRAHISANGDIVEGENVASVTDSGVGERTLVWELDYQETYHISISPVQGRVEIVNQFPSSVGIRTYDYDGNPADLELNVFVIGTPTPPPAPASP